MSLMTAASATAAAVVAATYLNAKLSIGTDLKQIRRSSSFGKRLQEHVHSLGDRITLYHLLEKADQGADGLWFEGKTWTYQQMKAEVDRLAKLLSNAGIGAGHTVSVYMSNSPEMVFTIYAISKLGAVSALINSALFDKTLLHCIEVADSHTILCTPNLLKHSADAVQLSGKPLRCIAINLGAFDEQSLESGSEFDQGFQVFGPTEFEAASSIPEPVQPKRGPLDLAVIQYTSGTTGKPKGVNIRSIRLAYVSILPSKDADDPKKYLPIRVFSCLPLFHGTCFYTGLCYSVGASGTFCLARKVSASRFWQQVTESKATRMIYVGELCRYLIGTSPGQYDRAHQCTVAAGNGLKKDIWIPFQRRFGIPEIREVYRATECVALFDNDTGGDWGAGQIGFLGPLRRALEDTTFIIKYDQENESVYRDPTTGFCVLADFDEPGQIIGRVQSMAAYPDYTGDATATETKLLGDVFRKGDVFQLSGDLAVQDRSGWVRFHDRIGDTFRWKGENVSAGEVREFICDLPNVHDAVIVGKQLANYDGQAGVAGISLLPRTPSTEAELIRTLYPVLVGKGLPIYALPRLVAITNEIAVGDTFKHSKQVLRNRDWDPRTGDGSLVYWLDGKEYKLLDVASWLNIEQGRAKL